MHAYPMFFCAWCCLRRQVDAQDTKPAHGRQRVASQGTTPVQFHCNGECAVSPLFVDCDVLAQSDILSCRVRGAPGGSRGTLAARSTWRGRDAWSSVDALRNGLRPAFGASRMTESPTGRPARLTDSPLCGVRGAPGGSRGTLAACGTWRGGGTSLWGTAFFQPVFGLPQGRGTART